MAVGSAWLRKGDSHDRLSGDGATDDAVDGGSVAGWRLVDADEVGLTFGAVVGRGLNGAIAQQAFYADLAADRSIVRQALRLVAELPEAGPHVMDTGVARPTLVNDDERCVSAVGDA